MENQEKLDFKKKVIKNLDFLLEEKIIDRYDLETCVSLLNLHRKISERFLWEEKKNEKPKEPYYMTAFNYFLNEVENGYPL